MIPIVVCGRVVGVLDVDSMNLGNFDSTDKYYLETAVDLLKPKLKNSSQERRPQDA